MNEIQMIFVQENTWKYNIACGMLTSDRHLLFQLPPFLTAYIVIAFVIFFCLFSSIFLLFFLVVCVCVCKCACERHNTHGTYEISAENGTKHRIVHISLHQMCSKGKKELTSEQHKKVHKLNQKWNNNSDKNWMQKIKNFKQIFRGKADCVYDYRKYRTARTYTHTHTCEEGIKWKVLQLMNISFWTQLWSVY